MINSKLSGKMITFVHLNSLNKMTLLIFCYGDQEGIPEY